MTSQPEPSPSTAHQQNADAISVEEHSPTSPPLSNWKEILKMHLHQASNLVEAPLGTLALCTGATAQLRVLASHQDGVSLSATELAAISQSSSGQRALDRQEIILLAEEEIRSQLQLPALRELIYAPLIGDGKGIGLLCLGNTHPHWAENEAALKLVAQLAHRASLTLDLAQAYNHLCQHLGGQSQEVGLRRWLTAFWKAMSAAQAEWMSTTWRQARQLRASERRFQSLVESGQDAVAIIQDGRFQYVNQRLIEMLGFSAQEISQMRTVLDVVVSRHRPLVAENQRKSFQGEPVPAYEFVAKDKNGSEVVLQASNSLIEFEGRPAIQQIWRNVTQQRQLRAQLLLTEKLAALGQLVSGVAHELNNPLTTVLGFSELVLTNSQLTDEVRLDLKTIVGEAHRARKIVQNLLAFSHSQDSDKHLIDINQVINETLELKEYELRMNNLEVIKQLAPELPRVIADVDQLKQVMLNIIINAEQAMLETKRRGRLVITTRSKTSYIAGAPTDWVEAQFRDTGPGVPEENLSRIFDSFFTTKELGKGTGLGLAISLGIIKDHGGRLYAQNVPTGGAEFIIELPAQTNS